MHDPERQLEQPSTPSPAVGMGSVLRRSIPQVLWQRKWTVLLTTALFLAAGVVYLLVARPMYTSHARLMVDAIHPAVLGQTEVPQLPSPNFLRNQAEVLKSATILAATLKQPGMASLRTFEGDEDPLVRLGKVVTTEVGTKDDVIVISAESPYADEAARIVNGVVDAYVAHGATQSGRGSAAEGVKTLKRERAIQESICVTTLKEIAEFKKAHPAISIEAERSNIEPHFDPLAKMSENLATAQMKAIEGKANYDRVMGLASSPEGASQLVEAERAKGFVLGHGIGMGTQADRLQAELVQLQSRLNALRQQATDAHPGIQGIEARAAELKRQMVDLDKRFAEVLVTVAAKEYAAAKEEEDGLRKTFDAYRQDAIDLGNNLQEYRLMDLRLTRAKKVSDVLDDRIRELQAAADAGALDVRIVEHAKAATMPTWPPMARVLAIALILGLMFGGVFAFVREGTDPEIRSSVDIEDALGGPVLTAIPRTPDDGTPVRGHGIKSIEEPQSHAAEAYRIARAALVFGPKPPKTILVTSAEPNEGKSLTVSNLAAVLAQSGRRVLVVDADVRSAIQMDLLPTTVRKHKLYQMFKDRFAAAAGKLGQRAEGQTPASQVLESQEFDELLKEMSERYERAAAMNEGLAAVLSGALPAEMAIFGTAIEGLDLLPCGRTPANLSELLAGPGLMKLINEVAPNYDHILFDAPAVLAMSDARSLAAVCDVTVLVVRAGKSDRKSVRLAREVLERVGGRIVGAIINEVPPGSQARYYTGYAYIAAPPRNIRDV